MKTNTKRFAGFFLTLVMLVAMFTMMSVSASAEEAGSADILGTYVNLGGDIELNYAVQLDEGVDIQDVKLKTVFLGVEKYLTATESDFNGVYYTFSVIVDGEEREAPDPYAKALGVNGKRSMVINLSETDPEGWEKDHGVFYDKNITDAIIY